MRENREAERIAAEIEAIADPKAEAGRAVELLARLAGIDVHYLRKENHSSRCSRSRASRGRARSCGRSTTTSASCSRTPRAAAAAGTITADRLKFLATQVRDMIYKEEHILYPMALELLSEEEWGKVEAGEGEIGFAWGLAPEQPWRAAGAGASPEYLARHAGSIGLDTGSLTADQINLMLTHLPVDLSFVGENDEVLYYSASPDRIFPARPVSSGGRVQNCHPPKSVDTVERILSEFKAGTKDTAEFWIQMRGKFLHIRYFAMRDPDGKYRGCLEVSQDVTAIRALDGERRLLDWA